MWRPEKDWVIKGNQADSQLQARAVQQCSALW